MRILVTGAGGFSGSELVSRLFDVGHQVTAVVGSSRGRLADPINDHGNLQIIQADLSKPFNMVAQVDAIIHAAARSPGPGVSTDDLVRDNVLATRNLITFAKRSGVHLFIFFSSLSVYGEVNTEVLNEQTPIRNPGPYGLTKLLCEEMLKAESPSLRSLAIRLPGIIGRGSTRNWLSRSLAAALTGGPIKIFNADAPFNNAVHITDLCRFLIGLLSKRWNGFDTVCLGSNGALPVSTVAKYLLEGAGHGSKIVIENSSRNSYLISSKRAQTLYDYSPVEITTMLEKFTREGRV